MDFLFEKKYGCHIECNNLCNVPVPDWNVEKILNSVAELNNRNTVAIKEMKFWREKSIWNERNNG